jgi:hypothetical protein
VWGLLCFSGLGYVYALLCIIVVVVPLECVRVTQGVSVWVALWGRLAALVPCLVGTGAPMLVFLLA